MKSISEDQATNQRVCCFLSMVGQSVFLKVQFFKAAWKTWKRGYVARYVGTYAGVNEILLFLLILLGAWPPWPQGLKSCRRN